MGVFGARRSCSKECGNHPSDYDILKHPNVTLTTDGKAAPYQHGLDNLSIASIVFDEARQEQTGQEPEVDEDRYELISDEEIEEFLKQQEENEHEEKQKA